MIKKKHNVFKMLPVATMALVATSANAAITLYDKDKTSVSVDASFNAFYVNSSSETQASLQLGNISVAQPVGEKDQSRVKAGFLPNWIGFNFSKEVDGLKVGGRSSFWVSTNDSNSTVTDSAIDVRQFYGTVGGSWGEVLLGKDFTLYNRNNIFMDEILLGYGYTSDALGLIDGDGVSFGNIGTGYTYPMPTSQIRYTSPDLGGFKAELAIVDPTDTSSTFGGRGEESAPRIEGQFTYANGPFTGWVGFMNQSSESDNGTKVKSKGGSFGVKLKFDFGLSLHASGYSGDGVGLLVGPADAEGLGLSGFVSNGIDEVESKGALLQASYVFGEKHRVVLSSGKSELDFGPSATKLDNDNTTLAYFLTVNPNFTIALEYTLSDFEQVATVVNTATSETGILNVKEENDTVALGLIVNF